uniref:Uncharacterized protein n=1 Tax=Arundo donax TaxID=35708 RepID=A0A0A8YWT3_ARUDO
MISFFFLRTRRRAAYHCIKKEETPITTHTHTLP